MPSGMSRFQAVLPALCVNRQMADIVGAALNGQELL